MDREKVMQTDRKNTSLKRLITMALLAALAVVVKRFLGFNNQYLSISFGFVPIALSGMLLGPLGGALTAVIADLIGALGFPSGPFNPLFTLSAALQGLIYGFTLHAPAVSKQRVALGQLVITVCVNLIFNTLLIVPIVGKGFFALLPARALKNALFFPIEVIVVSKLAEYRRNFERLIQ